MTPRVSILICTRNRAASLRETLRAVGRARIPSDLPAELIVIDNGSTDGTRAVVDSCRLDAMPVRAIHEPREGKCHAYNRGCGESSGEVLLWTDDDVRPPEDWIEGMCRPIVEGEADAVAGGVIFPPDREAALADPALARRRGWFACTQGADHPKRPRMVGANMAFARRVLADVPTFDIELGPGPEALGTGEETLFTAQLMDAGHRLAFRLEVAVEHHFDVSRTTRRHVLSAARRMGASEAYIARHWHHSTDAPTPAVLLRAWAGLWGRRMLSPWVLVAERAPEWEIERELMRAYWRQMAVETKRPAKYARRSREAVGA